MSDPKLLWSVSVEDVYNFIRCPRILALKLLGVKLEKWKPMSPGSSDVSPPLIGRIGEEAVAQVLSTHGAVEASATANEALHSMLEEAAEESGSEVLASRIIESVAGNVASSARSFVRRLVEESLRGALKFVKYLEAVYGKPQLYARARVVSTFLQTSTRPDFIVGLAGEKYVIVEVKTRNVLISGTRFRLAST